jgi:hypothetical protein
MAHVLQLELSGKLISRNFGCVEAAAASKLKMLQQKLLNAKAAQERLQGDEQRAQMQQNIARQQVALSFAEENALMAKEAHNFIRKPGVVGA